MSQASHDHFEWGFDHPSVSCVFLYYKFYYKATIGVQGKPRPLWKPSWDPLRDLCFFTTNVTRTGRLASKSSQCVPPTQLNATNPSVVIRTHDNLRLWRVGVYVCEMFMQHIEGLSM